MQSQRPSDYTGAHIYKNGDVVTISGCHYSQINGTFAIKCALAQHDDPVQQSSKPKKYRSTYNSKHGRVW